MNEPTRNSSILHPIGTRTIAQPDATAPAAAASAHAATSLRIDRLVLDGFTLDARDQARLRVAIETELGELMLHHAPRAANGGAIAALRAGDVPLDWLGDVRRLGREIARSLHMELTS